MLLKTFMAKFRLSPVKSSESTSWYVLDGGEKKKKRNLSDLGKTASNGV